MCSTLFMTAWVHICLHMRCWRPGHIFNHSKHWCQEARLSPVMVRVPQTAASALVALLFVQEDEAYVPRFGRSQGFLPCSNKGNCLILSSAAAKVYVPERKKENLLTISWAVVTICDLQVTKLWWMSRTRPKSNIKKPLCMLSRRLDRFPDMPCMKKVYSVKKRWSTGQQPEAKSAFRPAVKPRIQCGSNEGPMRVLFPHWFTWYFASSCF